jgi:transposase
MAPKTTLETIWYIPDDLWDKIRPLLGREKQPGTVGRPPVPHRTCLDGILHVLRTGCQWKRAPREFGSGSTLHRRLQEWARRGVFKRIWRLLLREYDKLRGIRWRWQAIDSATTKAPLGGEATGKSPVDRGKLGTKRHVLTDQRGAPIGFEVTGANRHDSRAAYATLGSIPVERPATRRTSRSVTGSRRSSAASDGISRSGGWLSARTVGRTATADCWCGGRRRRRTMWRWFTSLSLSISTA